MIASLPRLKVFALAATLALAGAAWAAPLPKPEGRPILAITGEITHVNDGDTARFDRPMLETLGTTKFRTKTPWYDHAAEFEGVPMKVLLDYVGAQGTEVMATALNDYQITIPMEDFERFGVILAMKRDGEAMQVRDKGPLFIVYPYDTDPELQHSRYYSRSAWQVKELVVR